MEPDQGGDRDSDPDEQRERDAVDCVEARRDFCGGVRSEREAADLSHFDGKAEVGVEADRAQCDRQRDQQGSAAECARNERDCDAGEGAEKVEFREHGADQITRQLGRRQHCERGWRDHRAKEQVRAEPATEQQPEAGTQRGLAECPRARRFRICHAAYSLQADAQCKGRAGPKRTAVLNDRNAAPQRPPRGIRSWLTDRVARYMSEPMGHYDLRAPNDLEQLKATIRKGDVLLVEGDQRVSAIIKYLTRSSWSHAVLYVGDELLRRDPELKRRAREIFGDAAEHLIVEALFDGVVAAPLGKYIDFNIRICRPHRLRTDHLKVILDEAIQAIGWRYDLRNILELALHLLYVSLLPGRHRGKALRFGSGASSQVICTSLLGQLFHKVGFPVLPSVSALEGASAAEPRVRPRPWSWLARRRRAARRLRYRRRHPTELTPRDFDLSPYFEIVKFSLVQERGFDYSQIEWEPEIESVEPEVESRSAVTDRK